MDKQVKIKEAVAKALSKYSTENVDIVRNSEENTVDIMYHSRHNSFCIESNVCSAERLTESDIDHIADCYSIGYVW